MDALTSDTVAVVLAGRKGARLDPLTRHVSKPALPFGAHRSIGFSLSNCVNSLLVASAAVIAQTNDETGLV
jgi:glucose-1-phosphate adenylyltransferase